MAATGLLLLGLVSSWLILTELTAYCSELEEDESLPRIGIIGAGIGGTSTAHFLRQLFGDKVQIDIFEADQVGGRMALVDIGGQKYEAGASIIHAKNQYMVQFNELYRKDKSFKANAEGRFGFYGADGMVFQASDWTAVTLAKLFWRYGFDLYTLQNWIRGIVLPQFERIYAFQDKGMAFTTCEDLLRAMSDDIYNMTQYSMKEIMSDAGLSYRLIDELGMAAMRNNYGQTTDVHGLVGAVSMIGTEAGLWSVIGGNKNIPEFLLKESGASLIKGRVTSVALVKGDHSTYELDYIKLNGKEQGQTESREYDLLFLATPVHGTKNTIAFVDFPSSPIAFSQDYHRTVVLFVQGHINKTTFHLEEESQFPRDVFTINKDLFFNSIGKPSPVDRLSENEKFTTNDSIWKVFLNHIPTQEEIDELFEKESDIKIVDWLAYPEYQPKMDLPPFVLTDHLYYVNAVESAATAVEMNAIGAKNVALLAYNHWYGKFDLIDESDLLHSSAAGDSKTEL